jgi:glyoxylase-like metal-dependent hydrolase (beta-lactamase superfamily II)/rhodanese-related sulfurtransferase
VILKQLYLGCLAQASYLVADSEAGIAAVVDPRRDVDGYLQEAEAAGVKIRHILLTHFHADFVSGHLELQRRTGATIHLGARGRADYAAQPAKEGDVILLGRVRLTILETPGHTPESISIVVSEGDAPPCAVMTGDTLFVGDVGRPDLMASVGMTARDLASMMYDSLQKLLALPDATIVYPGHGAGSLCGKALAEETFSTIGRQRLFNPSLQPMSREAFIALVTAEQPDAPRYFSYDADLNRRNREALDETMRRAMTPLPLDRLLELQHSGAQVVDAREADAYQLGHLDGSFHIPLSAKYATYSGMVLDPEAPIVVVADSGREEEAIMRLGRIGFDRVAGYLQGGAESIPASMKKKAAHVTTAELAEWLGRPEPPLLLDVRMPGEFNAKRLDGAVNIPLHRLRERVAEVPKDRWLALYCRTGHRSSVAQSILEQCGVARAANVDGGIEQWKAEGRAT